jgi:hypothetical protein
LKGVYLKVFDFLENFSSKIQQAQKFFILIVRGPTVSGGNGLEDKGKEPSTGFEQGHRGQTGALIH